MDRDKLPQNALEWYGVTLVSVLSLTTVSTGAGFIYSALLSDVPFLFRGLLMLTGVFVSALGLIMCIGFALEFVTYGVHSTSN